MKLPKAILQQINPSQKNFKLNRKANKKSKEKVFCFLYFFALFKLPFSVAFIQIQAA